jgi:hypothetical protein
MRCNSRSLGEDRAIPRRDFLQGALVGAATALTGPLLKAYGADMKVMCQPRTVRDITRLC